MCMFIRTTAERQQDRKAAGHLLPFCLSALLPSLICLLLSSIPVSSAAMTVDDIVAIPPVSGYVRSVLNRANTGITQAGTMTTPGGPVYDIFKPWWILYATSAMLSTVDTRLQITMMQRDLLEATPCLHLDIIILESKIEKVRQEMHTALASKQPFRILYLQHLIRFLNRRVAHLMRGARDPLYEDSDWARKQWFDPPNPVWCCPGGIPGNTCTHIDERICLHGGGIPFTTPRACQEYGCILDTTGNPTEGKLCPFDSNYLPPVVSGFGCDLQALPPEASAHPPTALEKTALADLILKRDAFVTRMLPLKTLAEEIDRMAGIPPDYAALGRGLSRTHRQVSGCLEQMPLAKKIGALSLLQTIKAGAYETRGPFSIAKNEPWMMVRFAQLLQHWGDRRPQSKALRYPSEFPPGQERAVAVQREEEKPTLIKAREWIARNLFRSWNLYHGKREAEPIAKSQDNQLQVSHSLAGMSQTIQRLGNLVQSHTGGLRLFGKSFAYYLRRSCIERPCNKRLDQVLRIIFKDSCFPYFAGRYYGSTQGHIRCKNDARITVSP